MKAFILDKDRLGMLFAEIAKRWDVYGPKKEKGENVFSRISRVEDLALDYEITILPAKKIFLPQREAIFSFSKEDGSIKAKEKIPGGKTALFGVKPCDVNAISILDGVMKGDFEDPYYLKRREGCLIVAMNCTEAYDECRCVEFDAGPGLKSGYDLLMTDLGTGDFLIEVGSDEGAKILEGLNLKEAAHEDITKKEERVKAVGEKISKKAVGIKELKELVAKEEGAWAKIARDCLYCGNCSLVCPTCFCYTINDTWSYTTREGERWRRWDSCLTLEFAEVAGANFRGEREARLKQRMRHKLIWFEEQFGKVGCVGCGRCVRYCPKNIDVIEVLKGGEPIPTG